MKTFKLVYPNAWGTLDFVQYSRFKTEQEAQEYANKNNPWRHGLRDPYVVRVPRIQRRY